MAIFDDLTVSGVARANLFVGPIELGAINASQGNPIGTPVALATGANANLALPGFKSSGPLAWFVSGTGSPTLSGIAIPAGQAIPVGQMILLVNIGSVDIITLANNSGSAVGNRIAAAVTISAGCGWFFFYNGTTWNPIGEANGGG